MVIISILACCLSNNCSPPRFKLGQHLFASKYQLVPALDRTGAVASASFKSYLTKTLKKKLNSVMQYSDGGRESPAPHHTVHSTIFNLRTRKFQLLSKETQRSSQQQLPATDQWQSRYSSHTQNRKWLQESVTDGTLVTGGENYLFFLLLIIKKRWARQLMSVQNKG